MCRAREPEHPEYHDMLQGLPPSAALNESPAYVAASSWSHGWIPAFAGMTHAVAAGLSRLMGAVMRDNPCKLFPLYAMR
jgi:hypothetical protein